MIQIENNKDNDQIRYTLFGEEEMNNGPQLPPRADRRAREDERLRALAARVRQLRALRGMPRQLCAEQSGVSLPHMARLEAGTFNVSVLVLDRIASALDLPLDALLVAPDNIRRDWLAYLVRNLPDAELDSLQAQILAPRGEAKARARRICLWGIRGAGKSTVGAMLAARLGLPFVELTREIEGATGVPVATLFEQRGQTAYRRLEETALNSVMQRDEFVLAAGGGIVAQPRAYTMLMRHSLPVWLSTSPEVLFARTHAQKDQRISSAAVRAHAMDNIRLMIQARQPLYETAAITVDTSQNSPAEVTDRIVEALKST